MVKSSSVLLLKFSFGSLSDLFQTILLLPFQRVGGFLLEFTDFCETPSTSRFREPVPQLDRCHNSPSALGLFIRKFFRSGARRRGLGGTRGLLSSVIQTWTWRGSTRITARRQNPRRTLTQCASVGAALGDAICSPHAQGAGTDCTRSRLVAKLNHDGAHLPSPFRQKISCTPIAWSTHGRPHHDT